MMLDNLLLSSARIACLCDTIDTLYNIILQVSYISVFFFLPDPVKKVSIGVSSLVESLLYWQNILGMTVYEQTETKALLGYDSDKCKLELIHLGCPVDHATAFGRIAFSCPSNQLAAIEHSVKEAGHTILTPLVSLDTPGKATVEVVILADPVINIH